MVSFPPAVRIWLGMAPVDLRRSFDGLAEQVRQHLHNDSLSGHIFVFRNKRGDRVKLLHWGEDGYVIVYRAINVTLKDLTTKIWIVIFRHVTRAANP